MTTRVPLIDKTDIVVNIVTIEAGSNWKPPAGLTALPHSTVAQIGDLWNGFAFVNPQPAERQSFLNRDLISLFTPLDAQAIDIEAAKSPQISLWLKLLYSRGEKPIDLASPTFTQAWGALTAVLGQERADELLDKLKGV